MSIRTEKVGRMIQREIADLLQNDFYETSQSLLTVTDVRMTPDLSVAYINISVMGPAEERDLTLNRLEGAKIEIRKALAQRIRHQMRHIPNLRFFPDESLEHAHKMEALFDRIKQERVDENPNDE